MRLARVGRPAQMTELAEILAEAVVGAAAPAETAGIKAARRWSEGLLLKAVPSCSLFSSLFAKAA